MPWLVPGNKAVGWHDGFWQPFKFQTSNALKLLDLVTYPCSVLISGLVVLVAAVALWPRLGAFAALAPACAWVVGNAFEVFLKATVVRPAVYGSVRADPVPLGTVVNLFATADMMSAVLRDST